MKQTVCDFCEKVLGTSILSMPASMEKLSISRYGIRADICEECYKSFNEWAVSRKERGNDVNKDQAGNEQEDRILDSEA